MTRRGLFIVMEGLDRSGKSTQSKLLTQTLNKKNMPCELWSYPNRSTNIGKIINEYLCKKIDLDDHAVHLLFSANRWETVKCLKEKLNSGINLVCDRYAYSGVAYTASKTGFDFEWCKQCDIGLPKPDLVCFLDTKCTDVNKRAEFGDERYEIAEFQKIVYNNFKRLFDMENLENRNDYLIINANDTIENIHEIIFNKVLELKQNFLKENEFKYLW